MSNLLLFIGGLLAIILGGLFAVPHYVDWNSYRGVFEEEATRILGREVRVRGAVSLRLLPRPYVSFEKIRIADNRSGTGGALFGAQSFTMWLAVPPLLKGTLEAHQIELVQPVLRLRLDENGGGNWEGLGPQKNVPTLLPRKVALDAVKISEGQVRVVTTQGESLFQLDAVNGTFSAPSLQGPFKLQATAKMHGRERDIRMSTSKRRDDGSVRLRGTVRLADTGNSYIFDGQVKDVLQRPQIEGTLLARLWLANGQEAGTAPKTRGHPIEMKGSVQAGALGAKLSDIAISFDHDGKPQLLTGQAAATWGNGLALDAAMEARWLDLDRIGRAAGKAPFATTRAFLAQLGELLPEHGQSNVRFKIDQANLGGDVISAVHLAIARERGEFSIKDLRAATPGGSRIALSGVLSGSGEEALFDGQLGLRGVSLHRFLSWVLKNDAFAKTNSPIYFNLNTDILAAADSLSARQFRLELPKSRLTGTGRYHWGNVASLAVSLDADQLDLTPFLTQGATLADVRNGLAVLKATPSEKAPKAALADVLRRQLIAALARAQIKVRAGRVLMGGGNYHDVNVDMALNDGTMSLSRVSARTTDGLALDIRGNVKYAAAEPKGRLSVAVEASDVTAVRRMARLLNLPADPGFAMHRLSSLVPLRLAGGVDLGLRNPKAADISLSGRVRDGDLIIRAQLDGGLQAARSTHIELTTELESRNAATLMAQLAPAAAGSFSADKGKGQFTLHASGIPTDGMTTVMGINSAGFKSRFKGTAQYRKEKPVFSGDLRLELADFRQGLALLGFGPLPALSGIPLHGHGQISGDGETVRFDRLQAKLSGVQVRSSGELRAKGGGYVVSAEVKAALADLPRMLGAIQGTKSPAPAAADRDAKNFAAIWTDAPIDFAPMRGMEGEVRLSADVLRLSEGLTLKSAKLVAALKPSSLELSKLTGSALAGKVEGGLSIRKTPGGAALKGRLSLDKAQLAALARDQDGKPVAQGAVSALLEFAGSGLSLRGIAGVLQGKGEMKVGKVSMRRLTPGAVSDAADAVIAGKAEGATLANLIARSLNSGQLRIPAQTLALKLKDGSLTAAVLNLSGRRARVVSSNTLELTSLSINSKWDITPKNTSAGTRPLPSVSVTYAGPLASLVDLEPQINAGALEREIAVRRLELEAGELERLRRIDEERAERERKRLEKLRLERERLEKERLARERFEKERLARERFGTRKSGFKRNVWHESVFKGSAWRVRESGARVLR